LEKEANGRAFRLIGVGLSGLTAPIGDSGDLLDPAAIKRGLAERASDKAREKFGKNAVMTGRGFKSAKFRENQAYSLPEKIKPDSID
jgi:DNA polymerase-4